MLVALQQSIGDHEQTTRAMTKILGANVMDKAKLFIKPEDLMDGYAKLSYPGQGKDREKDVITKEPLSKVKMQMKCIRCGGVTHLHPYSAQGHLSQNQNWMTWEQSYVTQCVCGGLWTS